MNKYPMLKNALLTVLFYLLLIILFVIPLGMFSFIIQTIAPLLLPIITIILLLINIWTYQFKNKKANMGSIIIHCLVLVLYLFLFRNLIGS